MSARFDLVPQASRAGLRRAGHTRRRDRRGRSGRGGLLPPDAPAALTRMEWFEDMVADAVDQLMPMWAEILDRVEFRVLMVPPESDPDELGFPPGAVPVGAVVQPNKFHGWRIEVFRKPTELLAESPENLPLTVFDAVIDLVADMMHVDPQDVHPAYGRSRPGFDD